MASVETWSDQIDEPQAMAQYLATHGGAWPVSRSVVLAGLSMKSSLPRSISSHLNPAEKDLAHPKAKEASLIFPVNLGHKSQESVAASEGFSPSAKRPGELAPRSEAAKRSGRKGALSLALEEERATGAGTAGDGPSSQAEVHSEIPPQTLRHEEEINARNGDQTIKTSINRRDMNEGADWAGQQRADPAVENRLKDQLHGQQAVREAFRWEDSCQGMGEPAPRTRESPQFGAGLVSGEAQAGARVESSSQTAVPNGTDPPSEEALPRPLPLDQARAAPWSSHAGMPRIVKFRVDETPPSGWEAVFPKFAVEGGGRQRGPSRRMQSGLSLLLRRAGNGHQQSPASNSEAWSSEGRHLAARGTTAGVSSTVEVN